MKGVCWERGCSRDPHPQEVNLNPIKQKPKPLQQQFSLSFENCEMSKAESTNSKRHLESISPVTATT